MFKSTNYINSFILIVLVALVIYFDSFKTISTQIQTILPNSEQKELLKKFNEFQNSKKILLFVEGLEKDSLNKLKIIENELLKINGLKLEKNQTNKNLQKFQEDYKFYINNFDKNSLINLDIDSKLEELRFNLLNANFSYFFDKNDPLSLLEKNKIERNYSLKNGQLIIKDLGYLSIFTINNSINSISQYEDIYDSIQSKTNMYENIKIFSPIFYFVENSRIIQQDVRTIILFSTITLILLYILILRDIKLLINSFITLSSSILLALFISSFLFKELSIFVIVFGISISTVAIDYMFHHYVHNHYEKKKEFNKQVFLGMFTTVGAFFIISFISFDLIKQICYFSIISLIFSYLQFSFLYPKIGFIYTKRKNINFHLFSKIKPSIIILFSIILILISLNQINFDSNLKNLDVENKKLNQLENFFNEKLTNQDNIPVLIKGNSINSLIKNSKILKNKYPNAFIPLSTLITEEEFLERKEFLKQINIDSIKTQLEKKSLDFGFKENFFDTTYRYDLKKPDYTLEDISNLGLEILAFKDYFITYANVPKNQENEFYKYDFVESLSVKKMFEASLNSIYKELILYGSLTILFIIIMVFISSKKNYLHTLSYIIFPFSLILLLSFFTSFNILHFFMLFIILSISIDYGIYMGSLNINQNNNEAILYSLLSTFAGFGVLIFSNINALFSIGITATIGILAITILLIILKRSK